MFILKVLQFASLNNRCIIESVDFFSTFRIFCPIKTLFVAPEKVLKKIEQKGCPSALNMFDCFFCYQFPENSRKISTSFLRDHFK